MNKSDLFLFFGFLLIIASMLIYTYYSYTNEVNECTSDPLKFAVEKIRENYDADYVYGEMTFIKDLKFSRWEFGDEYNIYNLTK